ncbi:amidase [Streptococcus pacificus]|uniref:Amidase n=1 Tax=Streptococcus pacificus TaxID=2740577 RepID=A0ABS0ZIZ8_9STRE|nr:amidase [Streptococcus pacificus]MBJ8325828.1 amidase [Streptococcus pacificus]
MIDATQMAQNIRSKEVSPLELVKEVIQKTENINPKLNAITSQRYEKALHEAKTKDFSDKLFAGVPIFLKDLGQEQEGEPSTSGSKLFKDYRATVSDYYVQKLEELGFIILGRTNTPEFGFKNISDSALHGSVNLPDDLSRNAGGSSGGAAALVAADVIPLAPASDGGGSIRIPASFNGLIGLKPTRGRIPVGPSSYRGWQGASVQFALTKTVRDTKNLLQGLQVYQIESPFPLKTLTKEDFQQKSKKPLKIAVQLESSIGGLVSWDAKQAVKKAVAFLEQEGHHITLIDKPIIDGVEAMQTYYLITSVETAAMFDRIEHFLKRPLTTDDMEVMSWALYQMGNNVAAKDYTKAISQWDQYSRLMAEFHQDYDLLLTPTTADVAPKHEQLLLTKQELEHLKRSRNFSLEEQKKAVWEMFAKSLDLTPFTQQANMAGQPSISLPVYRNQEGLALGVQLIAAKGREDLLLSVAELFEKKQQFL